ncbi:MAG: hypothetical protein ACLGSD_01420 [Acidobacteriota bacterium]
MRPTYALNLAAALSLAVCTPALLGAQSSANSQEANGSQAMSSQNQNSATSSMAANQMVPARAGLVQSINAKDAKQGQEFKVKLPRKVHLKDGTELPGGTMLIGKIGQDDMNIKGRSKLVLCIDHAQLKDGKTLPVKATIVGIYPPGAQTDEYYTPAAGDQMPNTWHKGIVRVDEIDALHNVDLHSNIDSKNSGVLVSKKDDDIKLKPGTELALAIADESHQQSMNGGGSGSH